MQLENMMEKLTKKELEMVLFCMGNFENDVWDRALGWPTQDYLAYERAYEKLKRPSNLGGMPVYDT